MNRNYACFAVVLLILMQLGNRHLFAQSTPTNQWQLLGRGEEIASGASAFTSMAAVTNYEGNREATPYIAFVENNIAKVKRLAGGLWQQVGGDVSPGNASHTNIFADGGNRLYVAYADLANGNRLAVKRFNAATQAWEPLGGDPYVSEGSILNGTSQLRVSRNNWMAFDRNNVPYVVYAEMGSGGRPHVKRFVNGSWELVGSGGFAAERASGVCIAFDEGDTPYVTYAGGDGSTGDLRAFRFSGGAWAALPASGIGGVRHASSVVLDGRLYVLYMDASTNSFGTVSFLDLSTGAWTAVFGGRLSGRNTEVLTLAKDGLGNLYASFQDVITNNSGRSVVRVRRLAAGADTWDELTAGGASESGVDEPGFESFLYVDKQGNPYISYVKANAGGVNTPIVRKFDLIQVPPAAERGPYNAWELLGEGQQVASGASTYTSVATIREYGTTATYVAFVENGVARARRQLYGMWEWVGGDISPGNASHTNIFADGGNRLYVAYADLANGNRLAVKRFNAATQAWEPLGGDPYVSEGSILNGTSQLRVSRNNWMAFDRNNVPYVVYAEMGSGGRPHVKRFVNGSWELVGSGGFSAERASGVCIAFDEGDTPYVTYAGGDGSTGDLRAFRFSGGAWAALPASGIGGVRHASSVVLDGRLYVLYMDASTNSFGTVSFLDLSTEAWTAVFGGRLSGRNTEVLTLAKDGLGNLYASFQDVITNNSGRSVVRVRRLAAGADTWGELDAGGSSEIGIDEPGYDLFLHVDRYNQPYVAYVKANASGVNTPVVRRFNLNLSPDTEEPDEVVTTPKQLETLDRGLVAVRTAPDKVYIGWRLFGTDPTDIAFNVYRGDERINDEPIANSTNFVDETEDLTATYAIRPVVGGEEQAATYPVRVWDSNFLSIPLDIPQGGTTPDGVNYTYTPGDASVGDLDGDGRYEIILKWDPTNQKDNAHDGYTGNVYIDAYRLDGTKLWRIDLGKNIRAGAHYTQFIVYDLDGDGKAEIAMKTADGTVDGTGMVIGDAEIDHRNEAGRILAGPEFLTIFNGLTGAAMATTDYLPARGNVSSWGDDWGNRSERYVAAVAYLDGARPSLVMGRGYYTRLVRVAWDWRDGELTHRWTFDSNDPGNEAHAGQGNHQMTVGDIDDDGKDEIINGASIINDNGRPYAANGRGHGDALHMTRMFPDRPNQQIWQSYEDPATFGEYGAELRDAKTGETLFGVPASNDVGRAMAADIDPNYPGYELWSTANGNVYNGTGEVISTNRPSINFGIWWDGDLQRELLDGTVIDKWNPVTKNAQRLVSFFQSANAESINGTKATPNLQADILGDWREEVIYRTSDNSRLLIFTTTIPTEYRIHTLMHNPQYRTAIAWQNSGYNQPPYPSFYLGEGMEMPEPPNIELTEVEKQPQDIDFPDVGYKSVKDEPFDPGAVATSALPVTYMSADPSIADVVNGRIVPKGVGTVTITAVQQGNALWLPAETTRDITFLELMPQSIAFDPLDKLITEYDDLDPGATASSGLPVAYISSDESIAIIVDGKIRGIAGGTVIITAVQEGDDYWEAASPVSHELLVIPRAAQTIAFHPIPELKVDHGDYDPQATATSGLPVIYTSSNTDVARVIDGKIRIFREGTATIVASQPGDSLWYAAPDVAHTLVVVGPDEPEVSSAVSPNGDGENDILFIEGIQNYPQNWLVIMDRNGVEVFRIAGYNNRDKVFDGRSSTNRLLPQGTYFYILETTYKGETKRRKGWFMLKYQ